MVYSPSTFWPSDSSPFAVCARAPTTKILGAPYPVVNANECSVALTAHSPNETNEECQAETTAQRKAFKWRKPLLCALQLYAFGCILQMKNIDRAGGNPANAHLCVCSVHTVRFDDVFVLLLLLLLAIYYFAVANKVQYLTSLQFFYLCCICSGTVRMNKVSTTNLLLLLKASRFHVSIVWIW